MVAPYLRTAALGKGGAGWNPAGLALEVWLDPSDLATLRQERTGGSATTPVAVGDPVGSARNKGTKGGWFVSAEDSRRPVLRSDGVKYWLEFDGIDDYLVLPAPMLSLVTLEVYLGLRIINAPEDTARGIVVFAPASGPDFNSTTGIPLYTNYNDNSVAVRAGPTASLIISAKGMTRKPHVVEFHKPSNTNAFLVVDGATASTETSVTGSFSNHDGDLLIGIRKGNGLVYPGNFELYGLIATNTVVTDIDKMRSYLDAKTTGKQPMYPVIPTLSELSAARSTLIGEVFATQGAVLPTDKATLSIESPDPLNGIAYFPNLASCEKLTVPGYAARPRLWTPTSPRSDVVALMCAGHSVTWNGNGMASVAMLSLLNANIPVCTFVLPGGPDDKTSGGPAAHDTAKPPLSEWVGPVVIAINALLDRYPVAKIYIAGISGGGWMATMCGACDTRIKGTYQFVGSLPDYIYISRDHEQRLPGVTADYMTLYLLGACPERRHKHILYENDPVGFNRSAYNTRPDWSVRLAAQAAALSGDYDLVWVDYNQHAFVNPSFTNEVVAEVAS